MDQRIEYRDGSLHWVPGPTSQKEYFIKDIDFLRFITDPTKTPRYHEAFPVYMAESREELAAVEDSTTDDTAADSDLDEAYEGYDEYCVSALLNQPLWLESQRVGREKILSIVVRTLNTWRDIPTTEDNTPATDKAARQLASLYSVFAQQFVESACKEDTDLAARLLVAYQERGLSVAPPPDC